MNDALTRFGRVGVALILGSVAVWALLLILIPHLMRIDYAFHANRGAIEKGPASEGSTFYSFLPLFDTQDDLVLTTFLRTLLTSFAITVLALVICYPIAFYLAQVASPKWLYVVMLCLLVPYWVNEVLRAYAWRTLMARRSLIYAVLVSPILAPGIVLGISTFIFWSQQVGLRASWWTAALAQSSFIAAYCMLIVMARLQRFDTTLEEAGLDLGASPRQVFWRITLPYLRPAMLSAAALAFPQSFENFTATYFSIGAEQTFTIFIANKVRQGVTPAVNPVAVIIVAVTVAVAIAVEAQRRAGDAERRAALADLALAGTTGLGQDRRVLRRTTTGFT